MKKKFLGAVVAAVCVVGLLAGCGSENKTGFTDEELEEIEEGMTDEDKEEYENFLIELEENEDTSVEEVPGEEYYEEDTDASAYTPDPVVLDAPITKGYIQFWDMTFRINGSMTFEEVYDMVKEKYPDAALWAGMDKPLNIKDIYDPGDKLPPSVMNRYIITLDGDDIMYSDMYLDVSVGVTSSLLGKATLGECFVSNITAEGDYVYTVYPGGVIREKTWISGQGTTIEYVPYNVDEFIKDRFESLGMSSEETERHYDFFSTSDKHYFSANIIYDNDFSYDTNPNPDVEWMRYMGCTVTGEFDAITREITSYGISSGGFSDHTGW